VIPANYPNQDEIKDAVRDWMVEHLDRSLPVPDTGDAAEDMVIDLNTYFIPPAEDLERECHVCERTIGEHTVDGRHPVVWTVASSRYFKPLVLFLTTAEYDEWGKDGRLDRARR
jgi:hypothetical protein